MPQEAAVWHEDLAAKAADCWIATAVLPERRLMPTTSAPDAPESEVTSLAAKGYDPNEREHRFEEVLS